VAMRPDVALVLNAWAINAPRRERFREACKARGWTFVEFYVKPTIYDIGCSVGFGGSSYGFVKASIPRDTESADHQRVLDDALVAAIAAHQPPEIR